jgi:hypothetical protein
MSGYRFRPHLTPSFTCTQAFTDAQRHSCVHVSFYFLKKTVVLPATFVCILLRNNKLPFHLFELLFFSPHLTFKKEAKVISSFITSPHKIFYTHFCKHNSALPSFSSPTILIACFFDEFFSGTTATSWVAVAAQPNLILSVWYHLSFISTFMMLNNLTMLSMVDKALYNI